MTSWGSRLKARTLYWNLIDRPCGTKTSGSLLLSTFSILFLKVNFWVILSVKLNKVLPVVCNRVMKCLVIGCLACSKFQSQDSERSTFPDPTTFFLLQDLETQKTLIPNPLFNFWPIGGDSVTFFLYLASIIPKECRNQYRVIKSSTLHLICLALTNDTSMIYNKKHKLMYVRTFSVWTWRKRSKHDISHPVELVRSTKRNRAFC